MSYILSSDITDVLLKQHVDSVDLDKGDDFLNDLATKLDAESVATPLSYTVKECLICLVCMHISRDRIGTNKGTLNLRQGSADQDIYQKKYNHYSKCFKELEQQITKEMIDGTDDNYTSYGFQIERA